MQTDEQKNKQTGMQKIREADNRKKTNRQKDKQKLGIRDKKKERNHF